MRNSIFANYRDRGGARAADPPNLATRPTSEPNGDNGDKANKGTN